MSDDDLFGSDDEEETTTTTTTTTTTAAAPESSKEVNDDALFGSDSDSDSDNDEASSNTAANDNANNPPETDTTNNTDTTNEDQEGAKQKNIEPPAPPVPPKVTNIALRSITSFSSSERVFDVVNPGTMYFNPHRFDKEKYNKVEEDKAFENANGEPGPKKPETIRWRYKPGTEVPESNARVVVWSDGTMSVVIGDNPLSVLSEVPRAKNLSYVYAKQIYDDGEGVDTCLECVGPVGRTLAIRSEANVELARVKVLGLDKNAGGGDYSSKRNVGSITSTNNPLVEKMKRENERDEALRALNRQREGAAGVNHRNRAGFKRAQNKSWLEGSDDEDEYSHMNAKRLDEDDSEESEEEMEMTLEEQKRQRQSRRSTRTRENVVVQGNEDAANDQEEELEDDDDDDDEDFVIASSSGKKRKLEDDNDDGDEDDEDDAVVASSTKRSRKNAFEDDDEDD
jgi:hypothetical protein